MGCLAYDVKNSAGNARLRHPGRQNSSRFHPGNRAEVFIWQNLQPAYWDPGWKNRDLGNRASPPSHTNNTSNWFYKGFRGKARSRKQGSCEETLRNLKRWIALSSGYICIPWIVQLISLILIRWIVIYPVDSAIQRSNNRCLASYRFTCPVSANSL